MVRMKTLRRTNRIKTLLAATAVAASTALSPAATHTWTGAGGGHWSTAGSWSGGAPTAGEAAPVVLVFPAAGSKFTTNDIANLTVDQIQISGDNYWIAGGGAGTNLIKTGDGELKLTQDHTYAGKTLVQGGSLLLAGSLSNSAVIVHAPGTFAGHGTIASLASSGGVISPGNPGGLPYGKIRSLGSINLGSASQFVADLGGTNAGVDMDQLEMLGGTLTIPGCSLTVTQHSAGAISNQYPILSVGSGGAAMGTFTGLPDNTPFSPAPGRSFSIGYFSGPGNNDIILTQLTAALAASQFTGLNRSGDGTVFLSGFGGTNAPYAVLANTNLNTTDWITLDVILATNGVLQFTDHTATNHPMRFYRFMAQ